MTSLYNLINAYHVLLIRKEIIVKPYDYFTPINTTDSLGLRTLFWTCCQIYNTVEIYSQDIPNVTFEQVAMLDRTKFASIDEQLDNNLQSYIMEPKNRNTVSLTSKDHIAFLEYFNQTSADKSAKYVKKSD